MLSVWRDSLGMLACGCCLSAPFGFTGHQSAIYPVPEKGGISFIPAQWARTRLVNSRRALEWLQVPPGWEERRRGWHPRSTSGRSNSAGRAGNRMRAGRGRTAWAPAWRFRLATDNLNGVAVGQLRQQFVSRCGIQGHWLIKARTLDVTSSLHIPDQSSLTGS